MSMKDVCPNCGRKFDKKMNDWAYNKYQRQTCAQCGWQDKERMPHNYYARRIVSESFAR